jgi:hypothetical protein
MSYGPRSWAASPDAAWLRWAPLVSGIVATVVFGVLTWSLALDGSAAAAFVAGVLTGLGVASTAAAWRLLRAHRS